jgi:HEAT repeat protein
MLTQVLLGLGLVNLALLVLVFLRRVVKTRIFALQDDHRFRWARGIEEVLQRGQVSEPIPPIRSNWHRNRAEEVLLQRWARATPAERSLLKSLFYGWGLFKWRRARLRRWGSLERARSALVLGRMECTETLPDILQVLKRARSHTRVALINAVELLGQPAAIDPLIEFLVERGVRHSQPVLSALIHCAQAAPKRLLPHLQHTLPWLRAVAAGALAEVVTSEEAPALVRAASDSEPEVRAKVASALGRAGGRPAVETLGALAEDPVWYVRLRAIRSLGELHPVVDADCFWRALQDKHWIVRGEAARALYGSCHDPSSLLRKAREEIRDRYALGALVSLLEREGVTWEAIGVLCSTVPEERKAGEELIRELLLASKATAATYAIEAHPKDCVRGELLQLVTETAPDLVESPPPKVTTSPSQAKGRE